MTTDERLMFHITQGYLRRWSLWNEAVLPPYAAGEVTKWQLFQNWKLNPMRKAGTNPDGSDIMVPHPMGEFENWPYWLILDLCRYAFQGEPFEGLMGEPENLKETLCDVCDTRFSDYEKQGFPQAMQ